MITKVRAEGFKSLHSVEVELGRVNVFIGANGSGKSNLMEAIGMLGAAAFGRVDQESLERRGSRPGSLSRCMFESFPAEAPITLSASINDVEFEVRMKPPPPNKGTTMSFESERLCDGFIKVVERPGPLGNFGDPTAGMVASKMFEMPADHPIGILLKVLREYSLYCANTPVLRGWANDRNIRVPIGLAGGRLTQAMEEIIDLSDERSRNLELTLQEMFSWFSSYGNITLSPESKNPTQFMVFHDRFFRKKPDMYFMQSGEVNEGILYTIFLFVLCLHPEAPSFFAVDDADHSLNPRLARRLMAKVCEWVLKSEDKNKQVMLTVHNPSALDGLTLEDDRVRLFTVDRTQTGKTTVNQVRISPDRMEKMRKGESLSRLWVMGHLGGVPNV